MYEKEKTFFLLVPDVSRRMVCDGTFGNIHSEYFYVCLVEVAIRRVGVRLT